MAMNPADEVVARAAPKVRRFSSFGAEAHQPVTSDFYRLLAPFVAKLSAVAGWGIFAQTVVIAVLVVVLAYGVKHHEAYASDGVTSCFVPTQPAPKP